MARGTGYQLSQYEPLIVQSARQSGISPNLLRSILKQESNFDPSQTGQQTHLGTAKGIAQLTPDTQAELGVKNPYDPNEAIPAAARYLAKYRQVGVDQGAENPDAYAAMVYYGGPAFKPTNRPAAGVSGPDVRGYANSVMNHAAGFAGTGPLPQPEVGQQTEIWGNRPRPYRDDQGNLRYQDRPVPPAGWQDRPVPPAEAAGPSAAGAPQGLRPTTGPLPTNWADVPGAPASMAVAPPSAFTASSPAEQARWNAVSTPQGYEAAVRALAGMGTSSPAARVTEDPGRSVPTVIPRTGPGPGPAPVITGPGSPMPPAGGSQGWAGVQGPPGSPSGPADPIAALAAVGRGDVTPASYWQGQPPPQAGRGDYVAPAAAVPAGPAGPLVSSPTQPVYNQATGQFEQVPRPPAVAPGEASTAPAVGNRTLSDERLARMGPEDIFGVVTNDNLTDADRMALNDRLNELQRQQSNGGR
jgi:hypothetical protein